VDIKENFKGHLSTINHHKMEVMRLCFKLGLYKQGILHDLSKYSPKEFISGVVFYTGDKSPNTTERRVTGKSEAWLHHKGRNRHHFEYWIDYGQEPGAGMQGTKMPVKYVVEMFCDRIAACKTYYKENYNDSMPFEYFNKNRKHYMMHPETMELLGKMLIMLKRYGEEDTLVYIRERILTGKYPKKTVVKKLIKYIK
jgi:hypothetical protein